VVCLQACNDFLNQGFSCRCSQEQLLVFDKPDFLDNEIRYTGVSRQVWGQLKGQNLGNFAGAGERQADVPEKDVSGGNQYQRICTR
jgi:hypothetical protein